jgi:GntR family transcriptional repressor for pyruvate dehydrogenase complex
LCGQQQRDPNRTSAVDDAESLRTRLKNKQPIHNMVAPGDSNVFRRLRIEPAYKAVSAEIERTILNGTIKPGTPLPTEQELAESFGVNRSTVREAIRQIEQEGLLQRREGRRLFVTFPDRVDFASRATRTLLLQHATFHELWEVALVLEPLAAKIAAQQRNDTELDQLAANLATTEALLQQDADGADRTQALVELDVAFHATVARASRNRALILARESVSLLYNPALSELRLHPPQFQPRNFDVHMHILDALRQRDADQAEQWMRRHLIDFQRGFAVARLDMNLPISLPT